MKKKCSNGAKLTPGVQHNTKYQREAKYYSSKDKYETIAFEIYQLVKFFQVPKIHSKSLGVDTIKLRKHVPSNSTMPNYSGLMRFFTPGLSSLCIGATN